MAPSAFFRELSLFLARRFPSGARSAPVVLLAALLLSGCGITRTVEIRSTPSGAAVTIDGEAAGEAPVTTRLHWPAGVPHRSHTIGVTLPDHDPETRSLSFNDASSQAEGKAWVIDVPLEPLRRSVPVLISSTVERAEVYVDGKPAGTAPITVTLEFTRKSKRDPWSTHSVEVKKRGFRAAGQKPAENAPFSRLVTLEDAETRRIGAPLEPVRYVMTPIASIEVTEQGVQLVEEKALGQVGEDARVPFVQRLSKITDDSPESASFLSRISVSPDGDSVLISRPFPSRAEDRAPFINLWIQAVGGPARTRVTDATTRDIEATISPDGRYIVFSSDRLVKGKFDLWRLDLTRPGGHQQITNSSSSRIDTDPALSPDGGQLAYTSYPPGSRTPFLWVSDAEGNRRQWLGIGKHPSWSPDGAQIVFAAPDPKLAGREKIWLMDADGQHRTQLTQGEQRDLYPAWTPDGRHIVYASNEAIDEETGRPNFDIWIMSRDGSGKTRLTFNGSYDTRPVVSPDGQYVYFFSNRGAKAEGEGSLQVWRLELPTTVARKRPGIPEPADTAAPPERSGAGEPR